MDLYIVRKKYFGTSIKLKAEVPTLPSNLDMDISTPRIEAFGCINDAIRATCFCDGIYSVYKTSRRLNLRRPSIKSDPKADITHPIWLMVDSKFTFLGNIECKRAKDFNADKFTYTAKIGKNIQKYAGYISHWKFVWITEENKFNYDLVEQLSFL